MTIFFLSIRLLDFLLSNVDTFAFTVFFVVPALVFFEVFPKLIHFFAGIPLMAVFCLHSLLAIYFIAQMNFLIAIRVYGQEMPFWKSFLHSLAVGLYVYATLVTMRVFSLMTNYFWQTDSQPGIQPNILGISRDPDNINKTLTLTMYWRVIKCI